LVVGRRGIYILQIKAVDAASCTEERVSLLVEITVMSEHERTVPMVRKRTRTKALEDYISSVHGSENSDVGAERRDYCNDDEDRDSTEIEGEYAVISGGGNIRNETDSVEQRQIQVVSGSTSTNSRSLPDSKNAKQPARKKQVNAVARKNALASKNARQPLHQTRAHSKASASFLPSVQTVGQTSDGSYSICKIRVAKPPSMTVSSSSKDEFHLGLESRGDAEVKLAFPGSGPYMEIKTAPSGLAKQLGFCVGDILCWPSIAHRNQTSTTGFQSSASETWEPICQLEHQWLNDEMDMGNRTAWDLMTESQLRDALSWLHKTGQISFYVARRWSLGNGLWPGELGGATVSKSKRREQRVTKEELQWRYDVVLGRPGSICDSSDTVYQQTLTEWWQVCPCSYIVGTFVFANSHPST
jgi:hypothetical protein